MSEKKEHIPPHIVQQKNELLTNGFLKFDKPCAEQKARQLENYFEIFVELVDSYEIRFNKNQVTIFDLGA